MAHNEWSVRVRTSKFALGGSYSVLVFLGDVPEDPSAWFKSTSYAGAHYVFSSGGGSGEGSDTLTQGFVSLDTSLAARSDLDPNNPKVVVPYLVNNVHWRVQKVSSKQG